MNHATDEKQSSNPPSLNLSLAGAFLIYGIMLFYFPGYAKISSPWSWIFYFLAYAFLLFSVAGTVVSLSAITKSEFVRFAGFGLAFGFIAFLLHNWSETQNAAELPAILLKFSALIFAMIGVGGIAMAIPHLKNKQSSDITDRAQTTGSTAQESKPVKSRFEQFISVIIALLSFMTALVPLIKVWLNLS